MRVLVEVVDRPLDLRGPIYHVGERLFLDTNNPQHREVLDTPGWVRRLTPHLPEAAALSEPPVDRMVASSVTRHNARDTSTGKFVSKHQKGR